MKYLMIEPEVKAIAPNIALMKWARYCEMHNYEYQYVRGHLKPDIQPDKMLMSCIFSTYSEKYENTINFYRKLFPDVPLIVGGAFPSLNPKWFTVRWWRTLKNGSKELYLHRGLYSALDNLSPKYNVTITSQSILPYHTEKIVLYTSRGCPNNCGYCAVPRLEGNMKSLKSISHMLQTAKNEMPEANSVVLYDNNFTEQEYFDKIIDELVDFGLPVDIHGLHVDSFTEHQAKRLSELKWAGQSKSGSPYIRFSFDKMKYAENIERALRLTAKHKIRATFFCYLLFNFTDSPDDFWRKVVKTQEMVNRVGKSIVLFPQRYEPLNALKRDSYVGPKWTAEMVKGLVRLCRYTRGFMSISPSGNMFRWIGYSKEEFINKIIKIGQGANIEKFQGDIIYELYS